MPPVQRSRFTFPVTTALIVLLIVGAAMLYLRNDEHAVTYHNAATDMIQVELPFPDAVTGKEFSVIGKARGTWFFEASFPIDVVAPNGNVITTGIAQAEGEWMTEEFVPFKADISVGTYSGPATLVLKKDNPSGLAEHDASISFPITIEY